MFSDDTHQNRWQNTALFIVMPIIFVFLVYVAPRYSLIWVVANIVLLSIFIFHMYGKRRENFLLVAAIVPNTIGPLISKLLLRVHDIQEVPENDLLVGYAFHISSLLALSLYVLVNVDHSNLIKISLIMVIALVFNIVLSPPSTIWHPGPELFGGISAPAASPLFVGRFVLTVLSAYIALNHVKRNNHL